MKCIKMSNGGVSQLCSENDVNKMKQLVHDGFMPVKDKNGKIIKVDVKNKATSDNETVQSILDALEK